MLRRAGDGSGRSGVRFSQVTSLTSAMLPRPEWVTNGSRARWHLRPVSGLLDCPDRKSVATRRAPMLSSACWPREDPHRAWRRTSSGWSLDLGASTAVNLMKSTVVWSGSLKVPISKCSRASLAQVGMRWAIKLLCSILVQCERATGHRIWVGSLPTSYRLKDDKLVPDQPRLSVSDRLRQAGGKRVP
jgi:hypothetical protein